MSYEITGEGKPLLFLHGWGVGYGAYEALLKYLSKNFKVLAMDLPGFGTAPEPDSPWGVEQYGEYVLDLCERLGFSPEIAVGHSNGGRILLHLTGERKNALGLKKLVLLGAAGVKTRKKTKQYLRIYGYKVGKTLLKPFPKTLERFRKNAGSADYRSASPVMRGTMSMLLSCDMTPFLKNIAVPTLLVWGKDDDAAPYSTAKIMEKNIPDAGLVTLEGGHWAPVQQLGITMRVLDVFLGGGA